MLKIKTRHLLTGGELSTDEVLGLLDFAEELSTERKNKHLRSDLAGQTLALLFEKPSLRTRVSFTVAMQELGGHTVECLSSTRKEEEPEDVAQVLAGYCHGILLRTHDHSILERMTKQSPIPILNGLSEAHHPCQVLADLLTLKQHFTTLKNLTLTYVGDGNNILHSLLLLAPPLGIQLRYSCPKNYEPNKHILNNALSRIQGCEGQISEFSSPAQAVQDTDCIYTDVWTSMGFEEEQKAREEAFKGYQVNEDLYSKTRPGALLMHCMPMKRGQEISQTMVSHPSAVFFKQSENRLHVQKALLLALMKR